MERDGHNTDATEQVRIVSCILIHENELDIYIGSERQVGKIMSGFLLFIHVEVLRKKSLQTHQRGHPSYILLLH